MARSPRRYEETALAAAVLLGLSFLVLTSHLRHGGFYYDDWSRASAVRFDGYSHAATSFWRDVIPGRPVLAFLLPVPHALFGVHPAYHLVAGIALSVLASLSFFAFLRAMVEFPHALALALLSLVFPWSDAIKLWPSATFNNVALIAYFLGSLAALRALCIPRSRVRSAIMLHGLAAVLYVISILTYEVAATAILLSGLLYRTRVSWRALRARWLLDAALVFVLLGVSLVATSHVRHVGSLKERVNDVPHFFRDGLSIFASTFLPRAVTSSTAKLVIVAAAAAVVAAAAWRAREREGAEFRKWLGRGAAGASAVSLGYVMFLGSTLFPLYSGLGDRVNTFAAFGFVVATYSVLALLALLIGAGHGRATVAILVCTALLVGLGSIQRVRDDVARYDATTTWQRDELARLRTALPRPPYGSTLFTFGYPAESVPGLPIFAKPWDLSGAVRLEWDDPSLEAVPIFRRSVSCGRTEVRALEIDPQETAPYGKAVFVDLPTGRVRHITSRRECLRARGMFRPGPLLARDSLN